MKTFAIAIVLGGMLLPLIGCNGDQEMSTQEQFVYTVKADQTSYEEVSREVYGDEKYASRIAQRNNNKSLSQGTEVIVPSMREGDAELRPTGCTRKKVYLGGLAPAPDSEHAK